MKKSWKRFWSIILITAGAAFLMIIFGNLLGGRHFLRNTFASTSAGLDGTTIQARDDYENFYTPDETGRLRLNTKQAHPRSAENGFYTFAKGDIRDLNIQSSMANVIIQTWDGDEVVIDLGGVPKEIERNVTLNAKLLDVNIGDLTSHWTHFIRLRSLRNSNQAALVIINLPKDLKAEDFTLITGLGTANVEAIEASHFYADLGMGQFNIDTLRATTANVSIGMGQGFIGDFTITDLMTTVGMGQLNGRGILYGNLGIDNGMGQTNLILREAEGGKSAFRANNFDYEITYGMGSVTIGGLNHAGIGGSIQGQTETSDHMHRLYVDNGMGTVTIDFEVE